MGSPLKQKPKKSTVSVHGQLNDAEADYQADLKAKKRTVKAATCAKCGVIKGKHKSDTHAFTTNPDDPDWEGGDTYDVAPLKQKGKYWYKINGKSCTKAEYNAYKNKPGSDEPGKTTNDPDASGNKAKIEKDRASNKASKKSTVLTEAQTKLSEKKPPLNYKNTPLDFSSPLKGKKRRERRELREAKYGTKSRRKARKIEGTTRRDQKTLERSDMKVAKKRSAKAMKRYKTFTDSELMARREQGPSYKTDSEKSASVSGSPNKHIKLDKNSVSVKHKHLDKKPPKPKWIKKELPPFKQSIQDSTVRPKVRTDIKIKRKLTDKEKEIQAINKATRNQKKSVVYDPVKKRLDTIAQKNPIATLFTGRKTPLNFQSPIKQTVNVPKHPDLKLKKTKSTKISQGSKKSKNPNTKKYDGPKTREMVSIPFEPGVEKAFRYIKKKISR